jgi:hypothetical protein
MFISFCFFVQSNKKGFRQGVSKHILPEPFTIEFHRSRDPAGLLAFGSLLVRRLPVPLRRQGVRHSGWNYPAEPAPRLQRRDRCGI